MATFSTTQTAITVIATTILLTTIFNRGVSAQGPVPGPSVPDDQSMAPGPSGASEDCFNVLLNMSDCLSYVGKGSKTTVPDKPCCPELAGLIKGHPVCLCQLLSNPEKAGLNIDVNRALKLPSACHLSTPPVSLCSAFGYPVAGPAGAPSPAQTPGGDESPEGFASAPATGKTGNGASTIACSSLDFLLALPFTTFLPLFL